ncbi:MAG TPA: hypothetical protein VGI02_18245 [Actinomycetospora sp.]
MSSNRWTVPWSTVTASGPPRWIPAVAPFLLSVVALLAGALVVADVSSPVRGVLVFVFVMVVPGWALLDCWDLARGWLGVALVVATSTSLATATATAQLYLGLWSPTATVLVLVLITVCAQAARGTLRRRTREASR